jgi:hypothetical protein
VPVGEKHELGSMDVNVSWPASARNSVPASSP